MSTMNIQFAHGFEIQSKSSRKHGMVHEAFSRFDKLGKFKTIEDAQWAIACELAFFKRRDRLWEIAVENGEGGLYATHFRIPAIARQEMDGLVGALRVEQRPKGSIEEIATALASRLDQSRH